MIIKRPMTLRARLSLFNAVFLSGVFMVCLTMVYFVLQTWLYHQVDSSLKELAGQVSQNITVKRQGITFTGNIDVGELDEKRQFVRIVDSKGQVLKHWGPLQDLPGKTAANNSLLIDNDFLEESRLNDDEPVRQFNLPVIFEGKVTGFVQTGQSLETIENMLQLLMITLLVLAPLTFAITLIAGRWLTGRALAPLAGIAATAERISEQGMNLRLDIPGGDEVARLAASLDRMLDRLEESFEGYRQFTGDASHELRTPLTIIKGEISLALRKERDNNYYKEVLQSLEEEVDRMIRMVEQLLLLARVDGEKIPIRVTEFELSDILQPILEQTIVLAQAKSQKITWGIPSLRVLNDPDIIQQIMLVILDNAIKYTPEFGNINVAAEPFADLINICITDTGPGIYKEHLKRIFDRFYRVDKERARESGGAGLGLAVARKLAHLIGGNIQVTSIVGQGTTFTIEMPSAIDNS